MKKKKFSNILTKIRKFGGYMSGMVMPNLGAFVAWGIITALFIPTGWIPNENFNQLVSPMLNYMIPILVGYTAGYNIHGQRGGVIGTLTTMGVIVGSDVTMISGAMIMGPLSSWILKKFDQAIEGKVKSGFEMFVNNFSLGIIGAIITLMGYIGVGPVINSIILVLTSGVNWVMERGLIPLLSIFMAPAQVLFLNNAVNHGIISPIAYAQAAELGKSIMFLVDSNCGPLLGTLTSIALFGKGKAKKTAPMAMFIAGIAGIGEVYFPFVLANPVMIFATMGGLAVSLFLLVQLGGGLVGMPSPGSLIAIAMMTPKDSMIANVISIVTGFVVAFGIGSCLLKIFGSPDDEDSEDVDLVLATEVGSVSVSSEEKQNLINKVDFSPLSSTNSIKHIVVACDSGMGSSAMGASILRNRLNREGYKDIKVTNSAAGQITSDVDMVITLDSLIERAKISTKRSNIVFIPINNFLKDEDYNEAIKVINKRNLNTSNSIDNKVLDKKSNKTLHFDDNVIFTDDNILLNQKLDNKIDAIRLAGSILVENGYVTEKYIDHMLQREEKMTTYMDNSIAIPHGLVDSDSEIKTSGISVIQVPEGVSFGEGKVAHIIIGIAGKDGQHLDILSRVALACSDEENIQKMKLAKSKSEILKILNI